MTGGVAVILGRFGDNFGAGMTGGMAYLYDPEAEHALRLNGETVIVVPVAGQAWEAQLKGLIERHLRETAQPAGGRDPAALGRGAAEVPPDRAEGDADPARASAERPGGGDLGVMRSGPARPPGRARAAQLSVALRGGLYRGTSTFAARGLA